MSQLLSSRLSDPESVLLPPPYPLQPVQLVVLSGALQRLGPSNPWRYTVGRLATLDLQVREALSEKEGWRVEGRTELWLMRAASDAQAP